MFFGQKDFSGKGFLWRYPSNHISRLSFCVTVAYSVYDAELSDVGGITYEQMQAIVESVLVEGGYYDVSPQATARHRTLAPSLDAFRNHPPPPL